MIDRHTGTGQEEGYRLPLFRDIPFIGNKNVVTARTLLDCSVVVTGTVFENW